MRFVTCLILTLAASSTACLRSTEFNCTSNTQCGAGGSCESVGFCAFPDSSCTSGERFADSAGSYANQCVGGNNPGDAGTTDSPGTADAAVDAPPVTGCPGGYAAITGGQGTHLYRIVTTAANWNNQRDFCRATTTSAYLAIPDDAGELTAIATLSASTIFWVGVSDSATEGMWVNTKGATQTFLPWQNGAPDDNGPGEDCVASTTTEFNDDRCNTQYRAVCECEP